MKKEKKKIAALYNKRLEHIISQIPLPAPHQVVNVEDAVVEQFHMLIDNLSQEIEEDYSSYKVSGTERGDWGNDEYHVYKWNIVPVRTKIFDLSATLKGKYNLDKDSLSEVLKSKVIELIKKISWQIILTILGIIGAIVTTYFIYKLKIK